MKTGQKKKWQITKSKKRDRSWTDRAEQYASKEECIKWNK